MSTIPSNARRPIDQPPHSAGQRFKGLKSYVDPSQLPSLTDYTWEDQARWWNTPYHTSGMREDVHIPFTTTDCTIVDRGNASPRVLRMSMYSIPASSELAVTSSVPMGFVFQPFADQQLDEEPVPQVAYGEASPPRCAQCGAYINPWVVWTASGQTWICNLCTTRNDVPAELFAPLDHFGNRQDISQRPELTHGTVDFVVTAETKYHAPEPKPRLLPSFVPSPSETATKHTSDKPDLRTPHVMRTLFIIDVSMTAASSGLVRSICQSIREALYGPPPNEPSASTSTPNMSPQSQVGFLTFDSSLHFYAPSEIAQRRGMLYADLDHLAVICALRKRDGSQAPAMYVVSDIDEVYLPTREGIFVDATEAREGIEALLDLIPRTFEATAWPHAAVGAAIQGGLAALERRGGQILLFQSALCSFGPGIVTPRNEAEISGTSKEKTLFAPQDAMWRDLADECAESGIGVNAWLFPESFVDVATTGTLTSTTGGDIFFHPRYRADRDEHVLKSELKKVLSRETGYNCSIRVRCSDGLHVSRWISLLYQPTAETVTAGILSADTSLAGLIAHTGSGSGPSGDLADRMDVFVQAAVLYTSARGERRVRVCNINLGRPSRLVANVFKGADHEAGVALFLKEAAFAVTSKTLSNIRAMCDQWFINLLFAYRRNCAAATQPGQLILPESYKALPVLGNAMLKTKALKGGFVSSDTRSLSYHHILSKGVTALMAYIYPRIVSIHDLADHVGLPDPVTGRLNLASFKPASYVNLAADGAYLMDNGELTILWLGGSVSPQILFDLFGVEDWEALGPSTSQLCIHSALLSVQVRNLIAHEETRRGGRKVPFLIARQNLDAAEIEFGNLLVEDTNNDAMSYVDYLCHLHRLITDKLTKPTGWNPF